MQGLNKGGEELKEAYAGLLLHGLFTFVASGRYRIRTCDLTGVIQWLLDLSPNAAIYRNSLPHKEL